MKAVTLMAMLLSAAAQAGGARVHCTVRSVHALKTEGGLDAKLEPLRRLLKKEPFTVYKTFKLLEEQARDLDQKVPVQFKLKNGKTLTLTFVERLLDDKDRTHLRLTVDYPGLKSQQKVGDGAPIPYVVGEYQGGTLLVVTTCKTQ
jgi:hypothetical protein